MDPILAPPTAWSAQCGPGAPGNNTLGEAVGEIAGAANHIENISAGPRAAGDHQLTPDLGAAAEKRDVGQ
ncbi:hypothetical protein A5731_27290 [Mycolicibacterium conceptionense]|nr:hypothetical protein ACT17_06555 [Mycolicibacterium conceptionense]OBK68291.1 hypothetical protein A5654_01120 [Mycolicibacterium fortuitum]OCB47923.1 hypothetical protein A5721_07485 [Mycolicibacterium vulneris]OBB07001.1 hypothetical protein A5718_18515 [Mycolicibacterium conceptionense]OBE94576.1 hypothetical protein A5731_27290 [Mycolicibacterium conceptionense]